LMVVNLMQTTGSRLTIAGCIVCSVLQRLFGPNVLRLWWNSFIQLQIVLNAKMTQQLQVVW